MNQDLSGLPVKCPNCKKILFKTTDKYDPNVSPRGDMLKSLVTYHLDFLLTSSTPVSSLTCPECTCQLAPYGRLTVIPDMMVPEGAQIIDKPLPTPDGPITTPDGPITTPFTSDGNPTPATEEADRVAKEASVAANKVLDKGIIDGKPDNEIINDMAAAVNKVIDDSLKDAIPAFICDVCGKECKNQFGLNSHKRSHK